MVLGRKTNFFLGKRWFSRENQLFSWGKDGFGKENQLFPRENQKNPKKKHLLGDCAAKVQKDGSFRFP